LKRRERTTRVTLLLIALGASGQCLAGAIEGKVVLVGAQPAMKKLDVTIDQYLCGTQKNGEDLLLSPRKEIRNVVVWLENAPAGAAWPTQTKKVEIDQKGCVYIPRIVLVPVGGTVDFLNSDRLLHNIHSNPKANLAFNRTQPKNRTIPIRFDKPEIVPIVCDLHPWMQAWVVVAAHPYYAITGADGQFTFDHLPAGTYRLRVWQERLGTTAMEVTVDDRSPARVTLEMRAS
jgi:plastocyanin